MTKLTFTVASALLLLTFASSAQIRKGQRYSDWSPVVHLGETVFLAPGSNIFRARGIRTE